MAAPSQVASVFRLLNLPVPGPTRLQSIASDGRSLTEIRDDLLTYLANSQGVSVATALNRVVRQHFVSNDVDIAVGAQTEAERLKRITQEILSGGRTLGEVVTTIQSFAPAPTPTAPKTPTRRPPPAAKPTPKPTPATPAPPKETVGDYKARVAALYPYLPPQLVSVFANAWYQSGDLQLALAEMRADPKYDAIFPGIKRDDGSLRMSEQEWFSTREAYGRLFQEFGLNDQLFSNRFQELMEGEVSPTELAGRLGAAYELIGGNLPEVRQAYSRWFGENGMSDAAIFASFIDPDIGDAIINRRVSIAQVGGEGLARGFDVNQGFAEKLVAGGVGQEVARNFFVQADGQLQTLDTLVARHRDPDDDFDLEEFAEANIFGDAAQTRRIRRVLRAEASLFTDRQGSVSGSQELALTGLSAR